MDGELQDATFIDEIKKLPNYEHFAEICREEKPELRFLVVKHPQT